MIKFYIGIDAKGVKKKFGCRNPPRKEQFPQFVKVIGPFKNAGAAIFALYERGTVDIPQMEREAAKMSIQNMGVK